jgi:hypothetical protein
VAVAHTFVGVWETVGSLLAELDVLAGFADLAARAPAPYVRPTLLPAPGLSNQQPCAASAGAGPGQQPQGQQGPGDVEMVDGSAAAAAPGQEVIDLRGCRHPCVEAQEGVEFIKNDCVMTKVGFVRARVVLVSRSERNGYLVVHCWSTASEGRCQESCQRMIMHCKGHCMSGPQWLGPQCWQQGFVAIPRVTFQQAIS